MVECLGDTLVKNDCDGFIDQLSDAMRTAGTKTPHTTSSSGNRVVELEPLDLQEAARAVRLAPPGLERAQPRKEERRLNC